MKKSLYFGGSVAVGSVAASVLAPNLPNVIPFDLGAFADRKTLSGRVMEVGLCSGAAWSINKYLLKNDISREDWTRRLAVVLASGFIGEYVSDYLNGKPMSYFK
jgi:hypothetical protein